jgi:hypothetical protein
MGKTKPGTAEHCTREGAEALAANLDAYWHKRGFSQVRHWAELQSWAEVDRLGA